MDEYPEGRYGWETKPSWARAAETTPKTSDKPRKKYKDGPFRGKIKRESLKIIY
jgi:hypothetical protein